MSKPTWEEEIEDQLKLILKEIKVTQDMVGVCMGGESKTPPKTKPEKSSKVAEDITEFSTLNPDGYIPTLTGVIVDTPKTKELNTKKGPKTVAEFVISDNKNEVRVTVWDSNLVKEVMDNYKAGQYITLTGLGGRGFYKDTLQVSTIGKSTIIES